MKLPRIRTVNSVLYALSAAIAITTLFGAYLMLWPQTVIANWTLTLPDTPIHAGQVVTIDSKYHKVKNVTGVARRYIECTDRNGLFITYPPLNQVDADHDAGRGGTGIVVQVPADIPNLPTLCRFRVRVEYQLYGFREVSHTNTTPTFTLLPAETNEQGAQGASGSAADTNSAQSSGSAQTAPTNATDRSTTTTTTTTNTPQSQSAGASVTLPDLNLDSLSPKE